MDLQGSSLQASFHGTSIKNYANYWGKVIISYTQL